MELLYTDKAMQIRIDIREKVCLIGGDSATGKTYIINRLKHYLREDYENLNDIRCNIPKDELIVFEDADISHIKKYTNKIIIIDRFDYLMDICDTTDDIKRTLATDTNTYILISRQIENVAQVSFNSKMCLKMRKEQGKNIFYTECKLLL